MSHGLIFNADCMEFMRKLPANSIDLTLTDIPYDGVNRDSNGLRTLDKQNADVKTFELHDFLGELTRITKGTIIVFTGNDLFSCAYGFFSKSKGTARAIVWEKTNPSPMNGEYIYLSGVELGVWFKKRGSVFNARCKNTVFRHPNGSSKLVPTEKNHKLLSELIADNSDGGGIVFDPCCGSGSTCLVASKMGRRFLGCELDKDTYNKAVSRFVVSGNNLTAKDTL